MAQLSIRNRFAQIMMFMLTGTLPTAVVSKHLTITESQHLTLPREVTRIRVTSGKAWVSHLGKDIVLYRGDSMVIEPRRDIAIVTSLGHKPVQLELNA